ncbi:uncharacterized protein PFL1_00816 [Pseudozyma flocculosa PF-1]|uniref:Zn(2)-C6 fungal-type domain-containing protein n=1 Tax=Pseudozyma flocculosa TaxID=84751 RepID=A0A5C3F2J1_9BASI|nr:uncharacterized protein PFL1_00816 [Pseudozyma flocculosa PF-1]EPQ31481.1 hypothetical protein PFL1_00816 [Pseudozyma flocculosa PF-1]SPO38733.1 uncharacterized protein PSFLO_04212 [Pseudozyma flocculosa]
MAAERAVKRPTFHRKRTSDLKDDFSDSGDSSLAMEPKVKSRARINMACVHCRHRKIKCDGAQPSCATCKRLRRHCDYEPVTEHENLMSRERKRRNKEKKQARLAALSVYAGNSPLSVLHPGSWAMASGSVRHYLDLPSAPVSPSYTEIVPAHIGASLHGFRPRSSTVNLGPTEQLPYHLSSVSQPQTPEVSDRSLGHTSVDGSVSEGYPSHYFFGIPTGNASRPTDNAKPPPSPASASNAEFVISSIYSTELPVAVPTSAHVRPIDLPAPHGHFDFASIPFPTQDSFSAEAPLLSLRRRSSVPHTLDLNQLRRPSVAEFATVGLVQRIAEKRAEKVQTDDVDRIRSAQALALSSNDSYVSNWRETTSQLWNDNFSLQSPAGELPPSLSFEAVAAAHYAQKTPEVGKYEAQKPASYHIPASTSATPSLHESCFAKPSAALESWSSPASTASQEAAAIPQMSSAPWTVLQQQAPLMSPVTDLQQTFNNLSSDLRTADYLHYSPADLGAFQPHPHHAPVSSHDGRNRDASSLAGAAVFPSHFFQN